MRPTAAGTARRHDDAAAMPEDNRILVGVIGAPHGIRGEVRVKSYTAVPTAIGDYRPLLADRGRALLKMTSVRAVKEDMVVARFEGVTTREAATALTNMRLYVDRDALPGVDDDEFYHADLIGLVAATAEGSPVGRVAAVLNFGAGDMLEIEVAGRDSLLVPFTRAFVPAVDLASRRIVVAEAALAGASEEDEAATGPTSPEADRP